jgi:putative membrane protein
MFISDREKQKISTAIREVEARTTGELITVIARESDPYHFIPTLWSALVALIVPGVVWLAGAPATLLEVSTVQLAVFLVLSVVGRWPPLKYRLVPGAIKRARAARLAREQFFLQGVSNTADRCGVLIFVSVAEHYVEILADTGIHAKIDQSVWQAAVDQFVTRVKAGDVAGGFLAAIGRCGNVLVEKFPREGEEPNELPDRLIEI